MPLDTQIESLATAVGQEFKAVRAEMALIEGGGGSPGVGVPVGGTTGQLLAKATATDYDTEWVDAPTGGGGGGTIIAVQATPPVGPAVGDLWLDIS